MDDNEHVVGSDDNDNTFARVQIDDPYIDLDKVIEEESKKLESIEIHVGKEFKLPDEAYGFCNLYALVKGFSISRNQRETSRKGLSGLKFVCSKQGLSERQKHKGKPVDSSSKPKTPEKERSSTRTDCKAYMRCKLVDGGIWQVSRFHDDHNHQLASNSPSKLRNLRSHRCLTMEDIEIIRSLSDQNVGPSNKKLIVSGFGSLSPLKSPIYPAPPHRFEHQHLVVARDASANLRLPKPLILKAQSPLIQEEADGKQEKIRIGYV